MNLVSSRRIVYFCLWYASFISASSVGVNQNFEKFLTDIAGGNKSSVEATLARNPSYINTLGIGGKTPLMTAASASTGTSVNQNAIAQIIQLLINTAGVDINMKDTIAISQKTALIYAIEAADVNRIKLLLDAGANINIQSYEKRTSLMYAVRTGKVEVIQQIIAKTPIDLRYGDIAYQDIRGYSVFYYAYLIDSADVFTQLLRIKYQEKVTFSASVFMVDMQGIPFWWFEKNKIPFIYLESGQFKQSFITTYILKNVHKMFEQYWDGMNNSVLIEQDRNSFKNSYDTAIDSYVNACDGNLKTAIMYAIANNNVDSYFSIPVPSFYDVRKFKYYKNLLTLVDINDLSVFHYAAKTAEDVSRPLIDAFSVDLALKGVVGLLVKLSMQMQNGTDSLLAKLQVDSTIPDAKTEFQNIQVISGQLLNIAKDLVEKITTKAETVNAKAADAKLKVDVLKTLADNASKIATKAASDALSDAKAAAAYSIPALKSDLTDKQNKVDAATALVALKKSAILQAQIDVDNTDRDVVSAQVILTRALNDASVAQNFALSEAQRADNAAKIAAADVAAKSPMAVYTVPAARQIALDAKAAQAEVVTKKVAADNAAAGLQIASDKQKTVQAAQKVLQDDLAAANLNLVTLTQARDVASKTLNDANAIVAQAATSAKLSQAAATVLKTAEANLVAGILAAGQASADVKAVDPLQGAAAGIVADANLLADLLAKAEAVVTLAEVQYTQWVSAVNASDAAKADLLLASKFAIQNAIQKITELAIPVKRVADSAAALQVLGAAIAEKTEKDAIAAKNEAVNIFSSLTKYAYDVSNLNQFSPIGYTAAYCQKLLLYCYKNDYPTIFRAILDDSLFFLNKYSVYPAVNALRYQYDLNFFWGYKNVKQQSFFYWLLDNFSIADFSKYIIAHGQYDTLFYYNSSIWAYMCLEISNFAYPNFALGLIMKKYPKEYAFMSLFLTSAVAYLKYGNSGVGWYPFLLQNMQANNFAQSTGSEFKAGIQLLKDSFNFLFKDLDKLIANNTIMTLTEEMLLKAMDVYSSNYHADNSDYNFTTSTLSTFFPLNTFHEIFNKQFSVTTLSQMAYYFMQGGPDVKTHDITQNQLDLFFGNFDLYGNTYLLHLLKSFKDQVNPTLVLEHFKQEENYTSAKLDFFSTVNMQNSFTGQTPLMYIIENDLVGLGFPEKYYRLILDKSNLSLVDNKNKNIIEYAFASTNAKYLQDILAAYIRAAPGVLVLDFLYKRNFLQLVIANDLLTSVNSMNSFLLSYQKVLDQALLLNISSESTFSFSKAEVGNTPLMTAIQVAQKDLNKKYYFNALKNINSQQWRTINPGNRRHPFVYVIRTPNNVFSDAEIIDLMRSYLDPQDINFTDNDNDSILMHACDMRRWDVVLYLLNLPGIDVSILNNKNQKDALTYVATVWHNFVSNVTVGTIIKKLLSFHVRRNMQSYKGLGFIGRLLQKLGANSTSFSENYSFDDFMNFIYMNVITKDDVTVFQEKYLGRLPLDWATTYMFPELLEAVKTYPELLLASNNPADMFYFAVKNNSFDAFVSAMQNLPINSFITGGNYGLHAYTPLMYVAQQNRFEMADYLIKQGANVNVQGGPYGYALTSALKSHALRIAYLLRFAGAKMINTSSDPRVRQFEQMMFLDQDTNPYGVALSFKQLYEIFSVALNGRIDLVSDFPSIIDTYCTYNLLEKFGKPAIVRSENLHHEVELEEMVFLPTTRNFLKYLDPLLTLTSGGINQAYGDLTDEAVRAILTFIANLLMPLNIQNKYYYLARYNKRLADNALSQIRNFKGQYALIYNLDGTSIPDPNYSTYSPFMYFKDLAVNYGLSYSWIVARSGYTNQNLYYELWQQSPAHAKAFSSYAKYVVPIPEPYVGGPFIGDYAAILAAYLEYDNTFIATFVQKSTQEQYNFFKSVNVYYAQAFAQFLAKINVSVTL